MKPGNEWPRFQALEAELKRMRPVYRKTMTWYRWYKLRCAHKPIGSHEADMYDACARAERAKGKP